MGNRTALVVGGGAFGTSIANVLALNFKKVILKVRSADVYAGLKTGENTIYLAGHKLAINIHGAITWDEVDDLVEDGVDCGVSGRPPHSIRGFIRNIMNAF